MSANRAWDRAGSLPVPVSGRRTPEVAALRTELPTVDDLFTFMRDAEHRFGTLRMRIEEHAWTARGEEVLIHDVAVRHPGEAKVLTSTTGRGHDRRLRGVGVGRRDGPDLRRLAQGRAPAGRSARPSAA